MSLSIYQWRLDRFSQKNIYLLIISLSWTFNRKPEKNSVLTPGQNDDSDVQKDDPNDLVPCLVEQRIAVIQPAGNKRHSCGFCTFHCHRLDERAKLSELVQYPDRQSAATCADMSAGCRVEHSIRAKKFRFYLILATESIFFDSIPQSDKFAASTLIFK